jgi:hypothetical protein
MLSTKFIHKRLAIRLRPLLYNDTSSNIFFTYISLIGDCSRLNCSNIYGGSCEVVDGLAKCECNPTRADSGKPVCGSDGKTYKSRNELLKEQCAEQRPIQVVIDDKGCGEFVNAYSMITDCHKSCE